MAVRGRRWHAVVLGFVLIAALVPYARVADATPRPNIVVVMTDDQTAEEIRFMPQTRALLGAAQGTTFSNSFVSFPLCCPSRATFLTGQYMHNHGVDGNGPPPNGGYAALDHTNTLPVWLRSAGYTTGHIGKYLNGYGADDPNEVPPGWTEWYGLLDGGTYRTYGYLMNRNGTVKRFGRTASDYQTDVIADDAVDFVERRAPAAAPFFLSVAPDRTAPGVHLGHHDRPDPARATAWGRYANAVLPRPPSFDEADVTDKPGPDPEPAAAVGGEDRTRSRAPTGTRPSRCSRWTRWSAASTPRCRRAASCATPSSCSPPTTASSTASTGFPRGKSKVYEEAVRVPLLVAGPGFPARTVSDPVINADLAPTFVELAGATARRVMDGRSLLHRHTSRPLLFEAGHVAAPFTAVRTARWVWVEYAGGGRELYDMDADPYQLRSRHADSCAGRCPGGAGPEARRSAHLQRRGLSLSRCRIAGKSFTSE